mmetsp:Transcript_34065/g.101804  ORF Transcript_34065/g.101804 Transcript_34065/m.101804 type:complete len:598 (+) Transcript_34065:1243-3036(+)
MELPTLLLDVDSGPRQFDRNRALRVYLSPLGILLFLVPGLLFRFGQGRNRTCIDGNVPRGPDRINLLSEPLVLLPLDRGLLLHLVQPALDVRFSLLDASEEVSHLGLVPQATTFLLLLVLVLLLLLVFVLLLLLLFRLLFFLLFFLLLRDFDLLLLVVSVRLARGACGRCRGRSLSIRCGNGIVTRGRYVSSICGRRGGDLGIALGRLWNLLQGRLGEDRRRRFCLWRRVRLRLRLCRCLRLGVELGFGHRSGLLPPQHPPDRVGRPQGLPIPVRVAARVRRHRPQHAHPALLPPVPGERAGLDHPHELRRRVERMIGQSRKVALALGGGAGGGKGREGGRREGRVEGGSSEAAQADAVVVLVAAVFADAAGESALGELDEGLLDRGNQDVAGARVRRGYAPLRPRAAGARAAQIQYEEGRRPLLPIPLVGRTALDVELERRGEASLGGGRRHAIPHGHQQGVDAPFVRVGHLPYAEGTLPPVGVEEADPEAVPTASLLGFHPGEALPDGQEGHPRIFVVVGGGGRSRHYGTAGGRGAAEEQDQPLRSVQGGADCGTDRPIERILEGGGRGSAFAVVVVVGTDHVVKRIQRGGRLGP